MKKVLAISFLAMLMCSCQPTGQTNGTSATDSVAIADFEEEEAQKMDNTIFAQVADSIFKQHPGDIKNPIIREDLGVALVKYCNQFKGKHMPLVEELPFKLSEVIQDGNKYIACFKYERKADENLLGLELQLAVKQTREEAAKLVKGDTYYVKGIMAGFPFQRVLPYALEPISSYDKPLLSLGALQIDNAEITKK